MKRLDLPVVKNGLCCGCGVCIQLFPDNLAKMIYNQGGYLRPAFSKQLTADELTYFNGVCPGINLYRDRAEAGVTDDSIWGPMLGLYTGHALDNEIRHQGSSGGALTALLVFLIESGEVDFVLHTRAADDNVLRNITVCSRNREELIAGAGSRYGPSAPLAEIQTLLNNDERFAFVGKPCDVAGLRQLARHDPRISERIPYALAFMCAGVPSEKGTLAVIERMGLGGQAIESFRYRGNGWPGQTVALTKEGGRGSMNYETSWGAILNRHLQWRCKVCPDGIGEFADITFADGWYLDDRGGVDFSERAGRSIILSRSHAGDALFKRSVEAGYIRFEIQEKAYLDAAQPFQKKRKSQIIVRLLAMFSTGRRPPKYKGLHLWPAMRTASIKDLFLGYIGTFLRLVQKRPM